MASMMATLDVEARPVQRALARSALYRLFSLACAYPTAERLGASQEEAEAVLAAGPTVTRSLREQIEPLASAFLGAEADVLEEEYRKIFGHLASPDCPAHETAYLGTNLFQQVNAMADVSGFYRAFGLTIGEDHRDRVDHISVELEFMRFLTYKEAFALVHHGADRVSICRRAQRRFWREHLGRWLPTFARLLGARAEGGFYGLLGQALEGFARAERRTLGWAHQVAPGKPDELPLAREMECALADGGCPMSGGDADDPN